MSKRSVSIIGSIDESTFRLVDRAVEKCLQENKESITVRIFSGGGDVYSALAIVGRLKASGLRVITELYGSAFSAAALIFACGNRRRMSRYGWFMWHPIEYKSKGLVRDHQVQLRQSEREWAQFCSMIQDFTKEANSVWLSEKELYLNADECIKLGVAHEAI